MNYLAHLLLSGDSDDLILGNFIGDSIKGNQLDAFPNTVQQGIRLHRAIDHFTDHHPVVLEGVALIRPSFRKYAPVVLDVYFDHFLALAWENYHNQSLPDFATATYQLLKTRREELPEKSQRFLYYMVTNNILVNYATNEGMKRVFSGMAYRAKFESGMENAGEELTNNFDALQRVFVEFFPDLQEHAREMIRQF